MSKKSKLILATALFGAALFGASCGGGGGGTTSTPPPPPPPPPPGIDGQVLALLNLGTVGAGTLKPVTICELKSDKKAYCGNDLNPTANVDLYYVYEFGNGNVLLSDAAARGIAYFFNGNQVIRPTSYRTLGATSDTSEPSGITIPDYTATGTKVFITPNFVILLTNSDRELLVITSSGKVIKDSHTSAMSVDTSCEAVTKPTAGTFKLNTDGTSTTTNIPTFRASADGKFLVQDSSNRLYLSNSRCSASGVEVDTISNVQDAQMVAVVEGTSTVYYIAVRYIDGGNHKVNYYKVTGNTVEVLRAGSTSITLASSPTRYFYALDGRGRLYAITATNTVRVYNTNGAELSPTTGLTITGVAGLLGLEDRVLAKAPPSSAYEISTTGSVVNARSAPSSIYAALNRCTDSTNTRAIDGVRTNFIRCLYDDGTNEILYSLTYNSGTYESASRSFSGAATVAQALFGAGKVLVRPGASSEPIYLCNTPPGSSISCVATDLPNLDTGLKYYLKAYGYDVFYTTGGGSLKVGSVFGPPVPLGITVSDPSGGNASLDLTKFAFSVAPASTPWCATQIVYLSSPSLASQQTYTIAQPSNACVARILKVY